MGFVGQALGSSGPSHGGRGGHRKPRVLELLERSKGACIDVARDSC